MESIVKKLFSIGAAALAIAVTLTSTSTQAITCTTANQATCSDDADEDTLFELESTFKFTVDQAFALNSVSGAAITVAKFGEVVDSGDNGIKANVTSNSPFTISLSATDDTGNLKGTGDNTQVISALAAGTELASGANSWAFRVQGGTENGKYVGLAPSAHVFYNSVGSDDTFTPAFNSTINLPFGVIITPTLPTDTYSTTVKLTLTSPAN